MTMVTHGKRTIADKQSAHSTAQRTKEDNTARRAKNKTRGERTSRPRKAERNPSFLCLAIYIQGSGILLPTTLPYLFIAQNKGKLGAPLLTAGNDSSMYAENWVLLYCRTHEATYSSIVNYLHTYLQKCLCAIRCRYGCRRSW